jgi:hypothetical protein
MTEQEWLECTDPGPILQFLKGKASDRKLRLFVMSCCRRMWHLLSDKRSRSAVERSELFADQQATTTSEWQSVKLEAWSAEYETHGGSDLQRDRAASVVKSAVTYPDPRIDFLILASSISHETAQTVAEGACFGPAFTDERAAHACLVRCVFGNPFCPDFINLAWRTSTVLVLAQAAYDNRSLPAGSLDTARLAILADTLEEAGCADADILHHCRSEGPHFRGCWVVDLILGKQ